MEFIKPGEWNIMDNFPYEPWIYPHDFTIEYTSNLKIIQWGAPSDVNVGL